MMKVRSSEDGRRNSFDKSLDGISRPRSISKVYHFVRLSPIYLDGGLITREWLLFKGFHNVRDGRLNALISLMELVNGG